MMRHGYAESISSNGDYFRALTPEGVALATRAARGLKSIVPNLDAIYTSPLRRARETGIIMGSVFGIGEDGVKAAYFLAESNLDDYFQTMARMPTGAGFLYVGHLPVVHNFVSRAVGKPGLHIAFSPNSVAILSFRERVAPGKAELTGFYTGEELAMLAEQGGN